MGTTQHRYTKVQDVILPTNKGANGTSLPAITPFSTSFDSVLQMVLRDNDYFNYVKTQKNKNKNKFN